MLPFKSLNIATSTGAGSSKDLEDVYTNHMTIVSQTGNPTNIVVTLEGSNDGQVWYPVATLNWTPSGASTNHLHADFPFRYVRNNLVTLTGGTSPTVSTTIASYKRDAYLA